LTAIYPLEEDPAIFNKNLSLSMKESQIIPTTDGFGWDITGNRTRLFIFKV